MNIEVCCFECKELRYSAVQYSSFKKNMSKHKEEKPLMIKCPNCKQTREPDYNETTKRYVCSVCSESVDVQVIIEKKKRGMR